MVPMVDLNPLSWLGEKAKEGLAEGWTATMIALWSAGMWLMRSVFALLDRFLTPDLTDVGMRDLYGATLWISVVMAVMLAFAQIGLALIRGDGTGLGALALGVAKYGLVVSAWIVVGAGLVVASAGLTTGLLDLLLDIKDFSGFQAGAGWPDKVGGSVESTVLGLTSLFLLLPAGFGYVVIMLVREAALLILAATMPISAAGSLSEGTKDWMWKATRWFLAACFMAPLLALVLGLGVQISRAAFPEAGTTGHLSPDHGATMAAAVVAGGGADKTSQIGMAVVGAVIMVIGVFCPMVLFRLLAFVDPGTGSGASMRATLHANGGVRGLLGGRGVAEQGSGAASQSAGDGRSQSEDGAETQTANRFQASGLTQAGRAGRVVGGAVRTVGAVGAVGAAMAVDVANQAGIGSGGYYDTPSAPQGPARSGATADGTGSRVPHHARSTAESGPDGGREPSVTTGDGPGPSGGPGTPPPAGGAAAGPVAEDAVFLA